MTDVVLAALCALMGAVCLSIVLLYNGYKRNRQLITELRAQIAAQQIAALSNSGPTSRPGDNLTVAPEPVRRKRHLTLYIGGIAAAFVTLGNHVRSAWRRHRMLTVTTAVATVAAGAAAAVYLASTSDASPNTDSGPVMAAPDLISPSPSEGTITKPDTETPTDTEGQDTNDLPGTTGLRAAWRGWEGQESAASSQAATPEEGQARTDEPAPEETGGRLAPAADTPVPEGLPPDSPGTADTAEPPPAEEPPPTEGPPTSPDPEPPAGHVPDDDGRGGLLCVDVRPILNLCVLGVP